MNFKNKVVIVTGSSRGIGKATALLFAQNKAKVVINCKKQIAKGKEVANTIGKNNALFIQADLTNPNDVKRLVKETLKHFGKIDILVNNAGEIIRPGDWQTDLDTWRLTIDANLTSAWLMIREVAPIMKKQRQGSIINIASYVGILGSPFVLPYSCAKAGIMALTKSMAKILAPEIRINAVSPGTINTEMTQGAGEQVINNYINSTPLKRIGEPKELAQAVLFLASDEASYINGQILPVDGGYTLK